MDAEAPPAKPPLGAEPTSRPSAGVTSGQERTGVRHGGTVLLRQKTAEPLGCAEMVQGHDVLFPLGAAYNGSNIVAQPHQDAAQRHNERMVHPIIEDGWEFPQGTPQTRPYGRVDGARGTELGRPMSRGQREGRQRGTLGSPKKRSRHTATPKGVDPTNPRVSAGHSGHVSRA